MSDRDGIVVREFKDGWVAYAATRHTSRGNHFITVMRLRDEEDTCVVYNSYADKAPGTWWAWRRWLRKSPMGRCHVKLYFNLMGVFLLVTTLPLTSSVSQMRTWAVGMLIFAVLAVMSAYKIDKIEKRYRQDGNEEQAQASDQNSKAIADSFAETFKANLAANTSTSYTGTVAGITGVTGAHVTFNVLGNQADELANALRLLHELMPTVPAGHVDVGGSFIPDVKFDVPILAHRVALLKATRTGIWLHSVMKQVSFDVDADATCMCPGHGIPGSRARLVHSTIPDLEGTCGFYAVPLDGKLTYESEHSVELIVELSGTVVEYDDVYRAEHQRVLEVRLPPCRYCLSESTVVTFFKDDVTGFSCLEHCAKSLVVVTREQLERQLGVPIGSIDSYEDM